MMDFWLKLPIRVRLILLFIVITASPLVLLVWVAWQQTNNTADNLNNLLDKAIYTANHAIRNISGKIGSDVSNALDTSTRDEIERVTTDTANRVAEFLYDRDADIRYAATLHPDEAQYRNFIENRRRQLPVHGKWRLNADKTGWEPENPVTPEHSSAEPGSQDNVAYFHYRPPTFFSSAEQPLYLEMSFIGLDGRETVKATTSKRTKPELKDVSRRQNTYARAETYFPELKKLRPGEIYVSEVIGRYVSSRVIGVFTPETARKRNIPFEPEKHAYTGKENPVGKRFEGIVRWATPVTRNGQIIGYVTFALNHDHLMSFADSIAPTEKRYRDISDASSGDYAFLWDSKGRNIAHPRHHSIVGYDENGEPAVPWLEDTVYADWQKSGQSWRVFSQTAPTFVSQSQKRKPAPALTEAGLVGLDCRWLNFAPQCVGWYNMTKSGGSGSFLTFWNNLWKITTAAAIPYYTGQYSPEIQGNHNGFGIVTISANAEGFHDAAHETKSQVARLSQKADEDLQQYEAEAKNSLLGSLKQTVARLTFSTIILIILAAVIATWMASFLTQKIGWLHDGFNRFRSGEKDFRFQFRHHDEITLLADSFNEMADTINQQIGELEQTIEKRRRTEQELLDIKENLEAHIEERTKELSREVEIRRAAEEKAQYMAGHDPLTGLANRTLFNAQLQNAINRASRSDKCGALLFLDLDRFKQVNDTLGHAVGDMLLKHMGVILRERVRRSDTPARLGGDEFAVIMSDVDFPEHASVLAQGILEKLGEPVSIPGGHKLHICSSIGIATFHNAAQPPSAEDITQNADMAMYQAKAKGGMCYCFFEESLQQKVESRKQLNKDITTALQEHQFIPYFQPLYQTVEHRVLYLEVLARWQHPENGILTPVNFMETAISSGRIIEVDQQIFEAACQCAKQWENEGLVFGRLSLNILQQYLENPKFSTFVQDVLAAAGVSPRRIAFEIDEYAFLKDSGQIAQTIQELRSMEISILIDRLEIERSILRNLIDYPIDAIKIDHALTSHIGEAKTDAIIRAIAALAHDTNFTLIAEGVETTSNGIFSRISAVRLFRVINTPTR